MGQAIQIVVIAEDPLTLKLLGFLLREEGYYVHTVAAVRAGLAILRSEPIDLIVLDINPPPGNENNVGRQLREVSPGVPVLVVSARRSRADKLQALLHGADDYIT